jgi:hypothetical protein
LRIAIRMFIIGGSYSELQCKCCGLVICSCQRRVRADVIRVKNRLGKRWIENLQSPDVIYEVQTNIKQMVIILLKCLINISPYAN